MCVCTCMYVTSCALCRYSGAEPTLSLEELKGFIEEVEHLPCTISEYQELKVSQYNDVMSV